MMGPRFMARILSKSFLITEDGEIESSGRFLGNQKIL